jgi:hypothetical protein
MPPPETAMLSFPTALRQASLEAFEGRYDDAELATKFDVPQVKLQSLQMILVRENT